MLKTVTNSVKTTTFCLSSPTTKSLLHFFPQAGYVTGIHEVLCRLTLYGRGIEMRTVALDGGRLGQPDGVRLEDAFPSLRGDTAGLFGLDIELSCNHSRVNLTASQCVVELVGGDFRVPIYSSPFEGMNVEVDEESQLPPSSQAEHSPQFIPMPAIHDAFTITSLVLVNSTSDTVRPELYQLVNGEMVALQAGAILANSAVEIPMDEFLFKSRTPLEHGWGLVRAGAIYALRDATLKGVKVYALARDAASKVPVSVVCL